MNGEFERWYPAETAETYEALRLYVYRNDGIKRQDAFAMSIEFDAHGSGFSSGQRMTANVMPRDGGSLVRVTGVGKIRTQVANQSVIERIANRLLAGVSETIQQERASHAG